MKLDRDFKRFKNTTKNLKIVGVDATSAPGNKTLQLMEICDKVYALERDAKRCKVLESRVAKANETGNVTILGQDFLETKIPHSEQVNFIICDPSCSGSGMKLHG